MDKIDYKKNYKEIYIPGKKPVITEIPEIQYVTVKTEGDPNKQPFSDAVEALYTFSYCVKMSYKKDIIPENYYQYTVFPLEGFWSIKDKSVGIKNKDNFMCTLMIRQPDFLNENLFFRFLTDTKNKKNNAFTDKLRFESFNEGLCCQILHTGSYDNEPETFKIMEKYCDENGYSRSSKIHKEIYLSDPRKTEITKLRTVLRFPVIKIPV
ncbi:MAG TPA: GyrI-like domain-containing protein [Tepiditoga sp.]|nr:GyrI-like domain-containing protein [Tepiditoga sp.]